MGGGEELGGEEEAEEEASITGDKTLGEERHLDLSWPGNEVTEEADNGPLP